MPTTITNANMIFRRGFAFLIDFALLYSLAILITLNFSTPQTTATNGRYYSLSGDLRVYVLYLQAFYWIFVTWIFGATVGKFLMNLMVQDEKGGKITLKQSIVRYMLLIVDGFGFGLVGLLVALSNDKQKRVGDKLAKTIVVVRTNAKVF